MKKGKTTILASIIAISLVSVAIGAGTLAYFSDTETSSGNILKSGTLDLKFDRDPDPEGTWWVEDGNMPTLQSVAGGALLPQISKMKPGDTVGTQLGIANFGNIDGVPSLHIANVVGNSDVASHLGDAITVTIYYGHGNDALDAWEANEIAWMATHLDNVWGDYAIIFGVPTWYEGPPGTWVQWGNGDDIQPDKWLEYYFGTTTLTNAPSYTWYAPIGMELEAGARDGYWRINFHFKESSGNTYQDETVSFDIVFGLDQLK